MDSDFESSNYNLLKTDISVNKFVTSFEFLQEDDEVGSESYESIETSYNINNAYSCMCNTAMCAFHYCKIFELRYCAYECCHIKCCVDV